MKTKLLAILLISIFSLKHLKAQQKAPIIKTDSITIYDTYLSLNSTNNISPVIYNNGLIYASVNKYGYYKLYFSDLKNAPKKIKINKGNDIISSAIYNTEIYFTKSNNYVKNNEQFSNMAIYKGVLNNFKVSKVKMLPVCEKEYSYAHPSISKDGQSMVMVSNEKGLYHLLELNRNENNEWLKGDVIFISQPSFSILNPTYYDKNTIYFSSNKKDGPIQSIKDIYNKGEIVSRKFYAEEGDYNIYKIEKENGLWKLPIIVNELNSSFDDLSVVFTTKNSGYLSSFRFDNTDNIYFFELKQ